MNDAELLGQFVRDRSQPAFAELVRRHVDWVYSAALRRVRDAHLADDVTQATFIVLATRAHSLNRQKVLSAWLFHVVAHVSAQILRREARRKRHEALAAEQMEMSRQISINPMNKEWEQVSHLLDGAVERLKQDDREAVMLRFFEQKSFAEVGSALGISEEAARKRVSRATDKLREILQAKGATMPATVLGTVLLAEITKPAPAAVVATATSSAATSVSAAGTSLALAKGVMAIMAWTKIKFAATVMIVSLLVVGGGVVVALQLKAPDSVPSTPPPAVNAGVLNEPWRIIFDSVYNLEDGQIVKRIAPPFIPERQTYYEVKESTQARSIRNAPDYFTFHWVNGQLTSNGYGFNSGRTPISGILLNPFGLRSYEFEGPADLLSINVDGDWIIRLDAPEEQKLSALASILSEATGKKLKFEKKTVLRDVWVASGEYAYKPDVAATHDNELLLYVGEYKDINQDGGGGGGGDFTKFFGRLGSLVKVRFVDETNGAKPQMLTWYTNQSSYLSRLSEGPGKDEKVRELLDVISTQSGLKFSREQRNVGVWQLGLTGG